MKNKGKKLQIQLSVSVVLLCLVGALCGVITWFSGVDFLYYLLLIPSVFCIVQLTSVFHEFGHYLSLKKGGFEVYYFKCSIFTVDKYGRKRIKVSLFGEHLGEIRFYPKKEVEYCKVLIKSLWSGIVGSVIIATVLNGVLALSLLGVFGQSLSPYFSLIFSFAPYSLYALLINVIPWFHPENDASKIVKISGNKNNRVAIDRFYAVQKQLFDGKTYSEIPSEYFFVDEEVSIDVKLVLLVYALRRAVETSDLLAVEKLINSIESQNTLNDEICCELLYNAIIRDDKNGIEKYSSVLKKDLDDSEPYVLRTTLANAKYVKDEQFFNVLKPTALKICEGKTFFKGDALYNKKLIELL